MMFVLGGVGGVGGTLAGTFLGLGAGAIVGALVNVLVGIVRPGIPGMYGSGSLLRWFSFSVPASALGTAVGFLLTKLGGMWILPLAMLIGGLVAGISTFYLQKLIPDWKRKAQDKAAGRSK